MRDKIKDVEILEEAMEHLNLFLYEYGKIDSDTKYNIEKHLVVNAGKLFPIMMVVENCIKHIYEEINKALLKKVEEME